MTKLSVIIPTFNECENIENIVKAVLDECKDLDAEVVVSDDDSPDGTWRIAEELGKRLPVVSVRRMVDKGLSPAVIEGFTKASGDVLAVMDADFSHPPEVIPKLYDKIQGGCDMVFGSRHIKGGGLSNWPLHRKLISKGASALARPLTVSTDPMSGLFMLKRDVLEGVSLNPVGFKIGLEILVKGSITKYGEVGYVFQDRAAGKSKLDARQYVDYVRHLARLYLFKLKGV